MSNYPKFSQEPENIQLNNILATENHAGIIKEIYRGLTAKHKRIDSRFFYNDKGSVLFEAITALPEYYPTRTESALLKRYAHQIIGDFQALNLIELGSGDCSKISILLNAIPNQAIQNVTYIPVDVSKSAIIEASETLKLTFPNLRIEGFEADFMKHLNQIPGTGQRLMSFFGSTLGNLEPDDRKDFLESISNQLSKGDEFLLGVDLVKDPTVLHNAYNDAQGITAAFNKNVLSVINEKTNTNFNPDEFTHVAFYNEDKNRIEMHLKAQMDLSVTSPLFPHPIAIRKGETIHTENSHKFILADIYRFAQYLGMKINTIYTDEQEWFALVLFKKEH